MENKESQIKVSVIVPVYNTRPYLPQCLDSLCGQTLKEIEILCIDDGSTDGSAEYLEEAAKRDGRIRVFRENNTGAGAARNIGLLEAKGAYLAFLDSDDFAEPQMLERMYREAWDAAADICVCQARRWHEDLKIYTICGGNAGGAASGSSGFFLGGHAGCHFRRFSQLALE